LQLAFSKQLANRVEVRLPQDVLAAMDITDVDARAATEQLKKDLLAVLPKVTKAGDHHSYVQVSDHGARLCRTAVPFIPQTTFS
jgi:hypothetical protein